MPFNRIAALVVGKTPSDNLPGLAQIISDDAIDADKIDYLNRDATACGIPLGIDVSRLFYRSALIKINETEARKLNIGTEQKVIFVINSSGMDSIEEVIGARLSLYHRVYHHQTTRNAERLFEKCFECFAKDEKSDFIDIFNIWKLDDFQLLRQISEANNNEIKNLSVRILRRELPKRSFSFGKCFILPMMPIDHIFRHKPKELKEADRRIAGDILDRMVPGVLDISTLESKILLKIIEAFKQIGDKTTENILISVLPIASEQVKKACIAFQSGRLFRSSTDTKVTQQEDAKELLKSKGYVLCNHPNRALVFFVIYKFLCNYSRELDLIHPEKGTNISFSGYQKGLFFDEKSIMRYIGLSEYKQARDRLIDIGFFDDFPQIVKVKNLDQNLQNNIKRFSVFDGEKGWHVNEKTCKYFISQFPPKHREEIHALISKIIILDREEITKLLSPIIKTIRNKNYFSVFITALTPNSGNRLREIAEQELRSTFSGNDNFHFCPNIETALNSAKEGDAILFIDDNMGSGNQAESQFRAWAGIPRKEWPMDQQAEQGIFDNKLSEDHIILLKKLHIYIGICVGDKSVQNKIKKILFKLGFKNFQELIVSKALQNHQQPTMSDDLKEFCKVVGLSCYAYAKFGYTDVDSINESTYKDECYNNALGYDNKCGTLVTCLNVPVSTLTLLWCPGFFQNTPWMPLFLRRGYLKKMIIT